MLGTNSTVADLGNKTLHLGSGRSIKLKDVASVASGASERRGFATLNGHSVVGFHVKKTKTASDVTVAKAVAHVIETLSDNYRDVTFSLIISTAESTHSSFAATEVALVEGMVLAAIVVFFFLRDWRATAIAALAMPISLIPTFALMSVPFNCTEGIIVCNESK